MKSKTKPTGRNAGLGIRILQNKEFYIMLLPIFLFYLVFSYLPMYGITLAFKDFNFTKGIMGSPWNDFANFKKIFS